MRNIRGNEFSMIFQVPMTSLNPVLTIVRLIGERPGHGRSSPPVAG